MANVVRDLQMGDYTITVSETDDGHLSARLSSGEKGGLLEMESVSDQELRIRELDIGSSYITFEQLAIMLVLTGADDRLIEAINKIKEDERLNK